MKHLIALLASILFAAPAMADRVSQDFNLADSDGDGYLTLEEITVIQEQSLDKQNSDTYEVLDANKDGIVDKQEYIAFYSKVAAAQSEETPDLSKNFDTLDTNDDGKLSREELKAFRTSTKDTTNHMVIEVMDTDKDGKVSRKEYNDFVKTMEALFEKFQ